MTDLLSNNPLLAVDVIVRYQHKIVLIERKNPPDGWAIPGGIVEEGESVETAARREIFEEVNLKLSNLCQWRVYSDPGRDPRDHTVSVCFTATGQGSLKPKTDAAGVDLFSMYEPLPEMAFDHAQIMNDYKIHRRTPRLNLRRPD